MVTAAFWARARPSILALSFMVMLATAMMVPTKVVPVSSVAELPTAQKTLQAWAPLMRTTLAFGAVMIVLPAWKMKTPSPLSVRIPVRNPEELKQ
jgi:hypothetical protein